MQVMIRVMLLLLLLTPHLILFFTPLFAPFSPAIFEPNLRERRKNRLSRVPEKITTKDRQSKEIQTISMRTAAIV
jgi:hypothetical protein